MRSITGLNILLVTATAILFIISSCTTNVAHEKELDRKRPFPTTNEYVSYVMGKNKGAIYSPISSYLRKNPNSTGKIVFELIIKPSGMVRDIKVLSSNLETQKLEQKIMEIIKSIDFGEGDSVDFTARFPIEFFAIKD